MSRRTCVSNNAPISVDLCPLPLWNPWNNQMRLSTEKLLWFRLVIYSKTTWTLTRIMEEDPALLRRLLFFFFFFKYNVAKRKRFRSIYYRGFMIVGCIVENCLKESVRFTKIARYLLLAVGNNNIAFWKWSLLAESFYSVW